MPVPLPRPPAPKPPLDPEAPARPYEPLWVTALLDALGGRAAATKSASEATLAPGMIEFPAAARQFTDPRMATLVRHILEVVGYHGKHTGGTSLRQLSSSALPRFRLSGSEWGSDPFLPGVIRSNPMLRGLEGDESLLPLQRLRERMTPAAGAEAEREATALLKLLFNPVLQNRYYRGPFPK